MGLLLKSQFEDPQDELDPTKEEDGSNQAEMNMTFFLYVIKDVLEYTGFIGDSSKHALKMATRELKMALAKFELLTQKTQYLGKVQSILEQWTIHIINNN